MGKMRFEEFTKAVVEKIREYLPETFAGASVELHTVVKNNDLRLTGLTIRRAESNICPTIYLEQFFELYKAGEEMSKVLEHIAEIRVENDVKTVFNADQITGFGRVRDRIVPRIVGRKWNAVLLSERPYTAVADLAVTYHILLGESRYRTSSVPITNNLMDVWGIKTEELHAIAVSNMLSLLPSTFRGMSAVLTSLITGEKNDVLDPADEAMFVLSNEKGMYGATAVLDEKIMKKIVERFGGAFFILPSSVHEVLIVPEASDTDVSQLEEMVTSINAAEVMPEERLSNHVYRYTVKHGLQLAR